jgi:hypothetical protein
MAALALAITHGDPDGPLPAGGSAIWLGLYMKIKSGPAVALPYWSTVTFVCPEATDVGPTKGLLVLGLCAAAACWAACSAF